MTSTATTETRTVVDDPIDVLVPPPNPWWVRLFVAVAIIVGVGTAGYAWHFGLIQPSPDCCGSSSAPSFMSQSRNPDAITTTAMVYNSSQRPITITGASAELAGATLVDVLPLAGDGPFQFPADDLATFPVVIPRNGEVSLAVTFVPVECSDTSVEQQWGVVHLDLEVANDVWYPTLGRTYDIPVVEEGANQLIVLQPAHLDDVFLNNPFGPLESACTLLGR